MAFKFQYSVVSDDKFNAYPTIFKWQWMLRDAFAEVRVPNEGAMNHNQLPIPNLSWIWT